MQLVHVVLPLLLSSDLITLLKSSNFGKVLLGVVFFSCVTKMYGQYVILLNNATKLCMINCLI